MRPSDVFYSLLAVALVVFLIFAAWRDVSFRSSCSNAGGHYVSAGRFDALCVDSNGRVIGSL